MPNELADFEQLQLETERLILEPVKESHAHELWQLLSDPELNRFVPSDPPALDEQTERCRLWSRRRSPDGTEIWLNWAARDRATGSVVTHFQAGVEGSIASIGYTVARSAQRKGLAREGMRAVFDYLRRDLSAREVKAWIDTRNEASQRLAKALGMTQVGFIKDADSFKGATSDEYVFSITFE